MRVLIKGMDMPKHDPDLSGMNKATIYNCKIFVDSKGGVELRFCGKDYPVIAVHTPHGRLIDADDYVYRGDLIYEPTIIEAEK